MPLMVSCVIGMTEQYSKYIMQCIQSHLPHFPHGFGGSLGLALRGHCPQDLVKDTPAFLGLETNLSQTELTQSLIGLILYRFWKSDNDMHSFKSSLNETNGVLAVINRVMLWISVSVLSEIGGGNED